MTGLQAEIVPAVSAGIAEAGLVEMLRELLERMARLEALQPPLAVKIPTAARALDLSIASIKRRVADGSLPVLRVGDAVRIDLGKVRGLTADEVRALAAEVRERKPRSKAKKPKKTASADPAEAAP